MLLAPGPLDIFLVKAMTARRAGCYHCGGPRIPAFGGVSIVVGEVLGQHAVHARWRKAGRRSAARAFAMHRIS